ncbi:Clp protease N-terminal domain-containing protein [Amycolatopsis sp. NPDC059021]|uniref:Clp protease N-terminal domain-containing protein n=1 Tax=Amycolatopsis sp. NPDC059021 TaxID=3346704 RepID=UPI00366BF588
MLEQLTEQAKQAVKAAEDEAAALGHDHLGTEHLLLGLAGTEGLASDLLREHGVEARRVREEIVRLRNGKEDAATRDQAAKDVLSSIGIDVAEIQRRADDNFGPGAFRFARPAFTRRTEIVFERTVRETQALGHQHIDTGHLLAGLLAEHEGAAIGILAHLGVQTVTLYRAVRARVAQ